MKTFNKFFALAVLLLFAVIITANFAFLKINLNDGGREYVVEINRIEHEIAENGFKDSLLDEYDYVNNIAAADKNSADLKSFLAGDGSDCAIREINGKLYRFDYEFTSRGEFVQIALYGNIILLIMSGLIIAVIIYIRQRIIKPFNEIENLPYELSKGNLTTALKERKSRYFGRFVWGLDLLREKLEQQKIRELELQRSNKTMILALSHDIKTPLSAIKLYSKAISKDLYKSRERQKKIAEIINDRADEIESYVSKIIKTSNEEFFDIEVKEGSYYFADLMNEIESYYSEKLKLIHINFSVSEYSNCLIKGDIDRAIEVIQNIVENAIKYGDGGYIKIEVSNEEDCRLVSVINSGCTLSKDELTHIFESFWRGSNVGTEAGSGLGLYICRRLLHKMDGEIFAECKNMEMSVTAVLRKN